MTYKLKSDMHRYSILSVVILLMLSLTSFAQGSRSIHVATAGTLAEQISEGEKYTIEQLTVTGELNGTDFRLLRDMAGNDWQGSLTEGKLRTLDLSGANIIEGGQNYLETTVINITEDFTVTDSNGFALATEANVVPQWGFVGCNSLNSISLPQTATAVGDYAFWNGEIVSVALGNSLQTVGRYAFYHNIYMEEISLPAALTSIGNNAFNYCSGLKNIYCGMAVPFAITEKVFNVYDKATLYVPVGSKSAYQSTDTWNKFNKIEEFTPATAITSLPVSSAASYSIYDMSGRRLYCGTAVPSGLPKGVYIVNNKKMMLK